MTKPSTHMARRVQRQEPCVRPIKAGSCCAIVGIVRSWPRTTAIPVVEPCSWRRRAHPSIGSFAAEREGNEARSFIRSSRNTVCDRGCCGHSLYEFTASHRRSRDLCRRHRVSALAFHKLYTNVTCSDLAATESAGAKVEAVLSLESHDSAQITGPACQAVPIFGRHADRRAVVFSTFSVHFGPA